MVRPYVITSLVLKNQYVRNITKVNCVSAPLGFIPKKHITDENLNLQCIVSAYHKLLWTEASAK